MQMLIKAPETARQLAGNISLNNSQIEQARGVLDRESLIRECPDGDFTESIMAADGANIIEHKTGTDIILAIAVGVDGLSKTDSASWPTGTKQFQEWQTALPHHVANPRLSQGIMFLMELSILAGNDRDVRIMDGAHLTTILKLNSLLSANDQEAADQPYVEALSNFLHESYEKVIPDIPNIIRDAFACDAIIGLTKYSSSREIIDSRLRNISVNADDKTFMSSLLQESEYTRPLPVGQSDKDKHMWSQIHIKCNLEIVDVDNSELEELLEKAIEPFKIISGHEGSELYFCYYKPFMNLPAYRFEIKKSLAQDTKRLENVLRSVKRQFIPPEIREPYPQYLADVMAKNISFGMEAVDQAICNDPVLQNEKYFDLIFPYRTH